MPDCEALAYSVRRLQLMYYHSMSCDNSVTNMGSRFPATRVLWLGREFYKVKHGVTSATLMAPVTLATNFATILAIWRQILRPWRQIDDSRKCNPFLHTSTRKGKGIHEKTPCDVTACRREYLRTAPRSEERLDRLGSPWSANAFGVLPAVRAGELSAIESAVIVY
ncbi:hypothetical protein AVEN_259146-1 [Araneus ventricosus]|uniref:Uncharacterized protein n=1 Tax=Araneus ventricosus TaxID=182803 RepID=A0A4Y2JQW9_ARAVE|nr:hypothetical protein AVEN_259146-1 [Araneus ventricosus]